MPSGYVIDVTTVPNPISNATTAGPLSVLSVNPAVASALPAVENNPVAERDSISHDDGSLLPHSIHSTTPPTIDPFPEDDPFLMDGETNPWQDDGESTRGLSAPSPTLDAALLQSPDADEDLIMLPSGSIPSPFRAHHEPTPTRPNMSGHPGPPYSKQAYILDALVILHITQQMTNGNHLYNAWKSVWDPFTKEDAVVAHNVCKLLNAVEKEKLAQHAAHLMDPNNVAFVGRDDLTFLCWLTRFRRGPSSDEDVEYVTVGSKAHVRLSSHSAEARGLSALKDST